jgi:hypothetical protein
LPLPPDRDLAEWDAEIEAEYSRFKQSWSASGRRKRAVRLVGVPWTYLTDICRLTEGRAALVVAIYIYRRTCVCHSLTVTLPSEELAELGVTRRRKSQVLAQLQQVRLIRVEILTGQTARVTLTWPLSASATGANTKSSHATNGKAKD